jgi:hypothetical protein
MMFRHETDKVRLLNGDRDGAGPVFPDSSNTKMWQPSSNGGTPRLNQVVDISWAFSPSAEEQAICFFFQNYIIDESSLARGYFDYLPAIYCKSEKNNVLQDAIVATGLAGLANFHRASNVMMRANFKYCRAVREISIALAELERAKEDQTLIAVMLLGAYEVKPDSYQLQLQGVLKLARQTHLIPQNLSDLGPATSVVPWRYYACGELSSLILIWGVEYLPKLVLKSYSAFFLFSETFLTRYIRL